MANLLEIELIRSEAGNPKWMRTIVRTLGLKKLHQRVILPDNGPTRGMVKKVSHMVEVRKAAPDAVMKSKRPKKQETANG